MDEHKHLIIFYNRLQWIGNWVKYIWETTHTNYKKLLSDWFKGICGGLGQSTMFEGWSDKKLETYNFDINTYDHTIVEDRSPNLLVKYSKQRAPYLTVIHLWDKMSDYLLSSIHNKLVIGRGEVGMSYSDPTSFTSTITKSPNK